MGKRKVFDWEAIEREYRAGQLSVNEIARRHGCTDGAIHNKARRNQWVRDLSEAVRKSVSAKLVSANVSEANANEKEIIESASSRGVEVIRLHRKDIASLRALEEQLITELQNNPTKLYITQYQGEIVQKEIGLTAAERAQAANNLANVQHKRIALERQAYNLNDIVEDKESIRMTGFRSPAMSISEWENQASEDDETDA